MKNDGDDFENRVRDVARQLWSPNQSGRFLFQGREHDGVFRTEETIHVLEVTTSRAADKARHDADKTANLANELARSHSDHLVRGWVITREEPTADQQHAVLEISRKKDKKITIESFSQFYGRLCNANSYLEARANHPFGSARNPETGDAQKLDEYIPLGLLAQRTQTITRPHELASRLVEGGRFVLLGDYGAGKSMTLREVWSRLRVSFSQGKAGSFPLLLNLREHHGEQHAEEAIERHARMVGFQHPSHLVRAWKAGQTTILLDGFDEFTSQGWSQRKLKELRYSATELVRDLLRKTPAGTGVIIAGREHYFDTESERNSALGLNQAFEVLSLNEFTDEQVKKYLSGRGWSGNVPAWFPARPLLVGYIAAKGLLDRTVGTNSAADAAEGWDRLLTEISEREAAIEPGIDGPSVRRIIERVASIARRSDSGTGPVDFASLQSSFRAVTGREPDDKSMILLQRLPGLGVFRQEEQSRKFVDEDLAAAARAGDVIRFLESPFSTDSHPDTSDWSVPISSLGAQVVALRAWQSGAFRAAFQALERKDKLRGFGGDLLCVLQECNLPYDGGAQSICGCYFDQLSFDSSTADLSKITVADCVITTLELDAAAPSSHLPKFRSCLIDSIVGRTGEPDMPEGVLTNCSVKVYAARGQSNSEIYSLGLGVGLRVLLVVLRKLYEQKGSGRKDSALARGLEISDRQVVPKVMQILERHGLALRGRSGTTTVWMPDRAQAERVAGIRQMPATSTDAAVTEARALTH